MIKSMTGFGRGEFEQNQKKFLVEIKSVNHRYNDIFIRMPRQMTYLENKVRDVVKSQLSRGKIDVYINYEDNSENQRNIWFDKSLVSGYKKALESIRDGFSITDDITVSLIARFPDVLRVEDEKEDEEKLWQILEVAVEKALYAIIGMRAKEGKEIFNNLVEKAEHVLKELDKVKIQAPLVVKLYKQKLESRLNELLQNMTMDEGRLETEVALFADKCCIDEEIVRFESHVKQLKQTLLLNEPVGKKLDFIIQEMNRETNTMGSKANDLDITKSVVEIKYEIEKIRELVQNIE